MHSIKNNLVGSAFLATLLLLGFFFTNKVKAQKGLSVENDTLTKSVLIHPVIETDKQEALYSREHTYRSQLGLGDQLARDFVIAKVTEDGTVITHKNNGNQNEDYISWKENVLAPFDAKVTRVNHPESTNTPGEMNRDERPGLIFFEKENGLKLIYAHVRDIAVEKGDQVTAGKVVAKVGNNGNSRGPHVHVGAWQDETPLQIQVDLYAEERFDQEKMTSSSNE